MSHVSHIVFITFAVLNLFLVIVSLKQGRISSLMKQRLAFIPSFVLLAAYSAYKLGTGDKAFFLSEKLSAVFWALALGTGLLHGAVIFMRYIFPSDSGVLALVDPGAPESSDNINLVIMATFLLITFCILYSKVLFS